jgi:REP element-mobilizing transposase RayT
VSIYIHKSHNVSVILYHLVCPAKYRAAVFSKEVDEEIKQICLEISKRYSIYFLEIGTDQDHVHFLIQSVPMYSPTKIARIVKSITARELFKRRPEVKQELWGGEFWTNGYFINSVSKHGSEGAVMKYVKNQGKQRDYVILHKDQLRLDLV